MRVIGTLGLLAPLFLLLGTTLRLRYVLRGAKSIEMPPQGTGWLAELADRSTDRPTDPLDRPHSSDPNH